MDHQYFNSTIISEINKMKMLNVQCNNVLVHCLLKVFQSYHVGVGSSFNASSQLQISWFEAVDIIFHSSHSPHLHHCSLPPPACNCVCVCSDVVQHGDARLSRGRREDGHWSMTGPETGLQHQPSLQHTSPRPHPAPELPTTQHGCIKRTKRQTLSLMNDE